VDTAIVNAYVIYNEQGNKDNLTLKTFRLALVNSLVGKSIESKKDRHPKLKRNSHCKSQVSVNKKQSESKHMPQYGKRSCTHCAKENEQRTHWMCTLCQVPLYLNYLKNYSANYHK